jgi:hypothetical protein
LFTRIFKTRFEMSSDFETLFNLHRLIFFLISFFLIYSIVSLITSKWLYIEMSLKITLIEFENKKSNKNLVLTSKSFAHSKTSFSWFLCIKSNILKTFFDRWFLDFDQQTKRQRFDDESQMMRKTRRNFIFFSIANFLFFVRDL